jgi:hypothetical protein
MRAGVEPYDSYVRVLVIPFTEEGRGKSESRRIIVEGFSSLMAKRTLLSWQPT